MINIIMGKQCQSCGMPLKKDENGGGTELGGSKSKLYCSKCFQSGEFTNKNITAIEMQDLVREKMKTMKMPNFLISYFIKDIPNLSRWKQ